MSGPQEAVERLLGRMPQDDLQVLTSDGVFRRYSFNARERNHLFHNAGGRRFLEAGYVAGVDVDLESRGVAVADFDRDGGLDLVVRSVARRKLLLFRNELPGRGRALAVELVGTVGNRDAVGAVVRVAAGGRRLTRQRTAGNGFQGQSDPVLHFGLGTAETVDELVVEWPGGGRDRCAGVRAGHRIRVVEGQGCVAATPFSPAPVPGPAPAPVWQALTLDGERVGSSAAEPVAGAGHGAGDDVERPAAVPTLPTLVALWATWCAPCVGEVAELNRLVERAGERLRVVGVSIEDDAEAARAFAERSGPHYPLAVATPEEMMPLLDAAFADGSARLPAAVLLDAAGRVVRSFQGTVSAAALEREVHRLEQHRRAEAEGLPVGR